MVIRMIRIRQFEIQNPKNFLGMGHNHLPRKIAPLQKNFWAALDLAPRLQVLDPPLLTNACRTRTCPCELRCVIRVFRPIRHITVHFGDECFCAINCSQLRHWGLPWVTSSQGWHPAEESNFLQLNFTKSTGEAITWKAERVWVIANWRSL